MNLQTLLDAVDQLPPDELKQLQRHIQQRQRELQETNTDARTAEARIAAMDAAIEQFREGLSEKELSDLLAAMSFKQKNLADLHTFDWLDDLPEDEH